MVQTSWRNISGRYIVYVYVRTRDLELRKLHTLDLFSAMLKIRDNIFDFLFAFLHTNSSSDTESTQKETNFVFVPYEKRSTLKGTSLFLFHMKRGQL